MSSILYAIEDIFDQAAFAAQKPWRRRLFRKLSDKSAAYADMIKFRILR